VSRARAWCRVDLAGGTLDIWPLGLMHPGSSTINVAVALPVEAEIVGTEGEYRVRQGDDLRSAAGPSGLLGDPSTALAGLVTELESLPPVEIRLASASPRGAGLGASSALTVALLAAAEVWSGGSLRRAPEERAAVARDLEARLMSLPTGMQDHLPGQLGGALAIHHRPGGQRVERLGVDLAAFAARLVVAYTGQSHFSAGNNWSILRRRFDGEKETVERLDRIAAVAAAIRADLSAEAWDRVGERMTEEWEARRGLAPEVSTPKLERLIELARRQGAWGAKACGAGGGGSIAVLAPVERREAVAEGLAAAGARILPATPTASGLEVTDSAR